MKLKKRLLTLYLLITAINIMAVPAFAGQQLLIDSSELNLRRISSSHISAYGKQQAFQYNEAQPVDGLFANFIRWLWHHYNNINKNPAGHIILKSFVYGLAAAALILGILKFAGMDKLRFFSRTKATPLTIPFLEREDDIHDLDIDAEIDKAVDQKAYRLAVRLLYLKTLRRLAELELIKWEKNKTNAAYCAELGQAELKPSFRRITRSFEYIWYGEFPVSEDDYSAISADISSFHQQIPRS